MAIHKQTFQIKSVAQTNDFIDSHTLVYYYFPSVSLNFGLPVCLKNTLYATTKKKDSPKWSCPVVIKIGRNEKQILKDRQLFAKKNNGFFPNLAFTKGGIE